MAGNIEVRNLTVYNQKICLLKNVNLYIKEKQITVLIGPSGCGKSTFLKALNRMNEEEFFAVTSGKVLLDGEDIYHPKVNKEVLRKKVGMIFQQPAPFPMSIYDNVAYGPRIHGKRKRRELNQIVEQSLKKAQLWEEVKERLHEDADKLSGGQKQRLILSRNLVTNPNILIIDNGFTGLDIDTRKKVIENLNNKNNKTTLVIISSMMEDIKNADKIYKLENKTLVEINMEEEVYDA